MPVDAHRDEYPARRTSAHFVDQLPSPRRQRDRTTLDGSSGTRTRWPSGAWSRSALWHTSRELTFASRRLTADPGFAVRFYRLTATLLSKRLRDLVALFITSPAIKPDTKTSPVLQGPVRLFDQTQPDFQEIERIVQSLPALSQICDGLQHGISDGGALTQRVKELSVATMAAESLQLLFEVAKDVGLTTLSNV